MRFWYLEKLDNRAEKDLMDKSYSETIYIRQFLRMTNQMFKWKNLPETIPARIMEAFLQMYGQICFTEVEGKYYVFFGNAGGVPNEYYEPTEFIVANPGLNFNRSLEIGKECVLIRNDSYFMGLLPMMERYAKQMSENDISILDAQLNMRIQSLIVANNDNAKKSADQYLEKVRKGEIGIILNKSLLENGIETKPFATAGTSNGISQLIELHQYLKASILGELGLNANFNMKRERINTAESELNQDALLPLVDDMLAMRKKACEEINAMYGLNIDVEKNSSWEEEELADEEAIDEGGADENEMPEESVVDEESEVGEESEVAEESAVGEESEDASESKVGKESDVASELVEAIETIVEEVIDEKEGDEDDGTEETE